MLAVVRRFAPPLLLMGLIFLLSSRPHLGSNLGDLDLLLRKCAHMTEYGLLAILWLRALGSIDVVLLESPEDRIVIAITLAISLLYAISDEIHQTFVRGRHGSPIDVLIDLAGMLMGLWLVRVWRARARARA